MSTCRPCRQLQNWIRKRFGEMRCWQNEVTNKFREDAICLEWTVNSCTRETHESKSSRFSIHRTHNTQYSMLIGHACSMLSISRDHLSFIYGQKKYNTYLSKWCTRSWYLLSSVQVDRVLLMLAPSLARSARRTSSRLRYWKNQAQECFVNAKPPLGISCRYNVLLSQTSTDFVLETNREQ